MFRTRRHSPATFFALTTLVVGVAGCASPDPGDGSAVAKGNADPAARRPEYRRIVFGCEARIVIDTEHPSAARSAAAAAFDRLAELDAVFSDYRVDSEVARLAREAGAEPIAVSDELFEVLELAAELHRRSRGVFDPTLGPVTRELRAARDENRSVDPEVLDERLSLVGFGRLEIDRNRRTVRLPEAGMSFDFGGIAKGYAADRALEVLIEHGFDAALVDLGGDIVVGSAPAGRPGWKIATEDTGVTLFLKREAVATTGLGAGDAAHLFDPRSGRIVEVRRPVTVVAPRCALADALATVVALLERERGAEVVGTFRGARLLPEPPRRWVRTHRAAAKGGERS